MNFDLKSISWLTKHSSDCIYWKSVQWHIVSIQECIRGVQLQNSLLLITVTLAPALTQLYVTNHHFYVSRLDHNVSQEASICNQE